LNSEGKLSENKYYGWYFGHTGYILAEMTDIGNLYGIICEVGTFGGVEKSDVYQMNSLVSNRAESVPKSAVLFCPLT
jgi:hypothetical protein